MHFPELYLHQAILGNETLGIQAIYLTSIPPTRPPMGPLVLVLENALLIVASLSTVTMVHYINSSAS